MKEKAWLIYLFLYEEFSVTIANVSFDSGLAGLATNMRAGSVGQQISMAVLKEILANQKQIADSLVAMMRQSTSSITGTGTKIDVRA
jgi:hypothetical protein